MYPCFLQNDDKKEAAINKFNFLFSISTNSTNLVEEEKIYPNLLLDLPLN